MDPFRRSVSGKQRTKITRSMGLAHLERQFFGECRAHWNLIDEAAVTYTLPFGANRESSCIAYALREPLEPKSGGHMQL
jgi:hypothetical protein